MKKKLKNWYEIHITITTPDSATINHFLSFCGKNNIKAIVLDLEKSGVLHQVDVMTSSKIFGTLENAFLFSKSIINTISQGGFTVIREKIESEPTHYLAPQILGEVMPENQYFEFHGAFLIDDANRDNFIMLSKKHNAHISKNPRKRITESSAIIMSTIRDFKTCNSFFQKRVHAFINELCENSIILFKNKIEIEFAIYDSNWKHDSVWIS